MTLLNETIPTNADAPAGDAIEPAEKYNVPPIDPIVHFLSKVNIDDALLRDMDACTWDQQKYDHYFKACDLFIIRAIIGEVNTWEPHDPNDVNYKAFNVLMKWFMYLIATNPWWHRKLCYYNRMMGTNTNSTSYWHVQWHPSYVSGAKQVYIDELTKSPKQFNDECMDTQEMYGWIDEYLCDDSNEVEVVEVDNVSDKIKKVEKVEVVKSNNPSTNLPVNPPTNPTKPPRHKKSK